MLIWVKLKNIPSVYWSRDGISVIASFLGTHLYTDDITDEATRIDFARVCVEVSLQSQYPHKINVVSEFNEEFEIGFEYGS